MNPRLIDLPIFASADAEIPAPRFNRVRLALGRLGSPLFLHIKELKHMGLILENDAWICVDEAFNEIPIVAWTDFHTGARQGLHLPVKCRLLQYHEHAGRILDTVMKAMDRMLDEGLREQRGPR